MIARLSACVLFGLSLLACGADADPKPAQTEPVTGAVPDLRGFSGGEFQLIVEQVDDGCIDGGMELLFMPEGTGQPYALKNPTDIPGFAALPKAYEMRLQAPFSNMQITMEDAGGPHMKVRNAQQIGLLLSLPGSDDCRVDLTLDADLTIVSADSLEMTATATLGAMTSPTETCPPVESSPCAISLVMRGQRQ